ncbi:GntR family transcriptional regulator [Pigmentiphaga sp. YJ18]|uniref:GntR family transcriptional regulator n=1 Tax=unclassified Pigmentiphaga TaxID=2626614 RepID=UPI001375A071|nr:GntR family transcriptional regulator [Pigmentiphaga sp. H8]
MASARPTTDASDTSDTSARAANTGPRGGLPMYAQLFALFRQRIENGVWPLNECIPSLDELMEEFDVGRVTVRHALGMLEAEGLVGRFRGRGTFVLARPQSNIWYRIPMNWDELTGPQPDIEVEWLESHECTHPPASVHTGAALGESYQALKRRLLRHHIPYGIGHTYIEKNVYAAFGADVLAKPIPLKILDARLPGGVGHAEQTVRASVADLDTARLLDLTSGAPVIQVTRSVLDHQGMLVYESLGVFRGDFVEIHTDLK